MTDLRDQLADFEAAAQRLLTHPPRLVLVHARPATCHPERPVTARGLCDSCYETHWKAGTLSQFPTKRTMRSRADFVADYRMLRSLGHTRRQIAARLGMTLAAVHAAYNRAVRAGDLPRERLTRMGWTA